MKQLMLFIFLIVACQATAQFPDFEFHKIGEFGNRMGQTALIDLDEDGDLDWIFGESGKMAWYEYM